MSLIKCSTCGKEIASNAKKCPHCGAPVINAGIIIGMIVIIFVLVFLLLPMILG